nr:MAG TPA: hypothetical protein [Caudoviricetes sp.]
MSRIVERPNGYNHPIRATSRARSGKAANCGHRGDKGAARSCGNVQPPYPRHKPRQKWQSGQLWASWRQGGGAFLREWVPPTGGTP